MTQNPSPQASTAGWRQTWRRKWEELVGIDLRSLAALRVGLALMLIYDLLARFRDLEAHYADTGVLPRSSLLDGKAEVPFFSLHLISGAWWIQGLLFLLALGAATALLLGWRTRWATVVSWLLLLSLHNRNPMILHGGDQILRLLLFWAMFVPWGRVASIDALGRPSPSQPADPRVVSVGTLALKLQLCGMYWFSAAIKMHPIWIEDLTAIQMALRLDQLSTPFGRWLSTLPEAWLQTMTWGTMVLETAGPALAFSPVLTAPLQLFAVALFVGFHVFGLAPAFNLGNFPFVCAAAWMMFLPSRFWEARFWEARSLKTWRRSGAWMGRLGARFARSRGLRRRQPSRRKFLTTAVVANLCAACLLVYLALWNLRTVNYERYVEILPPETDRLAWVLSIGQFWNLFAPYPATEDGWLVFAGTLAGGEEIDLRTGGPVSFEKPFDVSRSLGTERWRQYHMSIIDQSNGRRRHVYGKYLCREWNSDRRGDARLASFKMFTFRERTTHTGREETPVQGLLLSQACVLEELEPAERP